MRKAYDTFLQSEVSADLAAQSGSNFEPYRYECAYCGEEVHLAAVESTNMVSHFRHRSGNNDVECEKYLGQYGAISIDSRSRKSKNERAEFYFNNTNKIFYLELCFSENEINAYEQLATQFEFRTTKQEQAFFTLSINKRNFDADIPRMIPIEKFSQNYFISNTLNNVKRKYEVFNNTSVSAPTFFKVLGNGNGDKAKLVRSSVLYTNVPYFAVIQSQYWWYPQDYRLPNEIEVDNTFKFETMGRKFLGKVMTIKERTSEIEFLVKSWGYQLEVSETLTLLWPPAAMINGVSVVYSDSAFLFSSFGLQAHGNINVHQEDILKFKNGVSKVLVRSKIKVYKDNAEISIDKGEKHPDSFDTLSMTERHEKTCTVLDDSQYFLFNCSGVTHISNGQSVFLTPSSVMKYYCFGYLAGCIYPLWQNDLTGERLLNDILVYTKRAEILSYSDFGSLKLSKIASQYIEKCKKTGIINSAAKHFIMKGRL